MKTVLCYGDSNTYGRHPETGGRHERAVRWTGRLQAMLGDDYLVVEEGLNGRTTIYDDPAEPWKNGLPYLMPCLASHRPVDAMTLMLGTNDLKCCFHLTPEAIAGGVERLIREVKAFSESKNSPMPVILLMAPILIAPDVVTAFPGDYDEAAPARSACLAPLYKKLAEKYDLLYLNAADYAAPSIHDSLHMDAEGHEALAAAILAKLKMRI